MRLFSRLAAVRVPMLEVRLLEPFTDVLGDLPDGRHGAKVLGCLASRSKNVKTRSYYSYF